MSTKPFIYKDPFPLGEDTTKYRLITKDYVSVKEFDGKPVLVVDPKGLELLANEATKDISFMLRPAHLEQDQGLCSEETDAFDHEGSGLDPSHFPLP